MTQVRLTANLRKTSKFLARHANDIGRTHLIKHVIDTGDAKPVRQKCRRIATSQVKAIQDYVKVNAAAGTIRQSNSNWELNCVILKK